MQDIYVLLGSALACAAVAGLLLGLGIWVGPRRRSPGKQLPYECGLDPAEEGGKVHPVKFHVVAILFVIFDVEVAFLFPWAVIRKELGLAGFAVVTVFLAYLTLGLIYAWRKGGLEWR